MISDSLVRLEAALKDNPRPYFPMEKGRRRRSNIRLGKNKVPQAQSGPVDIGLNGPNRNVHDLSYLLISHLLEIEKRQHRTIVLGQPGYQGLHVLRDITSLNLMFEPLRRGRYEPVDLFLAFFLDGKMFAVGAALLDLRKAEVACDPVEPRSERAPALESLYRLVYPEEDLLGYILVAGTPHHSSNQPVYLVLVTLDELREGLMVLPATTLHEIMVAESGQRSDKSHSLPCDKALCPTKKRVISHCYHNPVSRGTPLKPVLYPHSILFT